MDNPATLPCYRTTRPILRSAALLLAAVAAVPLAIGQPVAAQEAGTPATIEADALRPAAPQMLVKAAGGASWTQRDTNVVLLEGGVEIQAGEATLQADSAVLWIEKLPGEARSRVDVVLLGTATTQALIATPEVRKFGRRLVADMVVEGGIRFDIPERVAENRSKSPIYEEALPLRPTAAPVTPANRPPAVGQAPPAPGAARTPVPPLRAAPPAPVRLSATELRTTPTDEGQLAVIATGGVFLMQRTQEGDLLELRADRAVVFTTLERLDQASALDPGRLSEAITGVYLEGDVRAAYTPGRRRDRTSPQGVEQRLEASEAYYDFTTDRALLTRAVLHTSEPTQGQPITVRARVIRQLAEGEYEAHSAELSTSRFAVPDYSLNASRIFVRIQDERTVFGGDNLTARVFGVPAFYFPFVRGASFDNRLPLRSVNLGSSRDFGFGVETRWGLWETFGATPPATVDATYSLNYFSDRGPAAGLDADYFGDLFLFGANPVNFNGNLEAFLVDDSGADNLGGARLDIPFDELRGRAFWQHQHYLPEGVSTHARIGYASDPTFLEQWEERQFNDGLPHDLFFSLERSQRNELLALQVEYQINDFPTIANQFQESAAVERLPELRYGRFGDRLGPFTLASRNRVGLLHFQPFEVNPVADLGLLDRPSTLTVDESFTGIPAYGYTGITEDYISRGDFRQELSLPIQIGPINVTPYGVGRFTAYSDDLDGDTAGRVLGGAGVRVGTAIVGTSNAVYSKLLDLDRIRHVIEPSVHGFYSAQNIDRGKLYIFDPEVDGISDIRAVQVALRQRWQTMRGAPGRKRSVDVFTFGAAANFFEEEPDEAAGLSTLGPVTAEGFRGLFFSGEPEASLARDGINADALWRLSDTTALVSDAAWNLEQDDLATVAAGVIVTRGDRVSYSLGGRYVDPLDLTLAVGSVTYNLSQRYTLNGAASFDFEESDVRSTNLLVTRRFDRFFVNVGLYLDRIDDDQGIRFSIYPVGFGDVGMNFARR